MHLLISKKIIIYLLLFCFLVSINNTSLTNISFPKINQIEISGLNLDERKKIESIIYDSNFKSIFHLDKQYLINQLENNILISSKPTSGVYAFCGIASPKSFFEFTK